MSWRAKKVDLVKHPSAGEAAEETARLWPEIYRLSKWASDLLEKNHLSERIEEAWRSQG